MKKIKLGSKVRCIHSGFEGVAVTRTEFINGCIQYGVISRAVVGKELQEIGIDSGSLEVIKPVKKKKTTTRTGGPNTGAMKLRGY